jgi:hydroxyacylglutathione hydrolase
MLAWVPVSSQPVETGVATGEEMPSLEIRQFACLSDNYCVLGHDPESGATFCIDAPDAAAVLNELQRTGWKLSHLFITHHHPDHTQGLAEVKARTGAEVIGPDNDAIAGIERKVGDGDRFEFAGREVRVLATPGHTLDMINFHLPSEKIVFTGDTLFAMGCGRVFEGNPAMMWQSLQKLMALPKDTAIYCGHEYTLANGRFALTVDGANKEVQARVREVEKMRANGEPTVPTLLARELATNPFLRASDPAIRRNLGMEKASDAEVFAEIRERKNRG